jgi:phosphoenolpyruvate carboxykinase (GTP)
MSQCPSYTDQAEAPAGVPISAIVFGGRRERLVPLVQESKSWKHGVLLGASMASETTAANIDTVGVVRRDPMAMKPFCGYNFGDYWKHWLSFTDDSGKLPKIFHVNWFRKDANGKFMWPGFGENMRVLEWIIGRCKGEAGGVETPIGNLPEPSDLNLQGIEIAPATMSALLEVDTEAWQAEIAEIGEYLESFGDRTPEALEAERARVAQALESA